MIFSAYLLVTHGSRNVDYHKGLDCLSRLIQQKFITSFSASSSELIVFPLVKTACLELASIPLSESIVNFAHEAIKHQYQLVKILPLFLLSGVHVKEDIPKELAIAKRQLNNRISLQLMPHLGSNHNFISFLSQKLASYHHRNLILLAHGSNFKNGNQETEKIATQLNISLAYWSINPTLDTTIQSFLNSPIKDIFIIPYFLFPGRITLAIANQVRELQQKYTTIKLHLEFPLFLPSDLANLIVDSEL